MSSPYVYKSFCAERNHLLFQVSAEVGNSFTLVGKTKAETHLCRLIMQTSWINRHSSMTCESLTEVCRRKTAYSGAARWRDLRKETETKSLWPSGAFIHPWGSVTILMLVSWVIERACTSLAPSRQDSYHHLQACES